SPSNLGPVVADVAVIDLSAANGNDTLIGNSGNDTLIGSSAVDRLDGDDENLVYNGSFELAAGGTGVAPAGWQMTGTTTDGVATVAGRQTEGNKFYSFGGWSTKVVGTLSQTINTVYGTTYTLSFTFNQLDSWDVESFLVWINDSVVSNNTFVHNAANNYANTTPDMAAGTNYAFAGWNEIQNTYVITFNTSATNLKLGFGSQLNSMWNDEAWGVDNLVIQENLSGISTTYTEGTTGNDSNTSTAQADSYAGGVGNDTISGGAGNDYLTGGDGNDTIDGGSGNDSLTGGWGVDTINGGTGADTIDAGAEDDTVWAEGANLITNGSFESALSTGWTTSGNVVTTTLQGSVLGTTAVAFGGSGGGGANNGVLMQTVSTVAGSNYTLGADYWAFALTNGLSQSMRVQVISGGVSVLDQTVSHTAATASVVNPQDFEWQFTAVGANTTVLFSDTSTVTNNVDGMLDNIRLFLDNGDSDRISGGSGNDLIYGGAGDDWINGGAGSDTIFGGAGSDTVSYYGSSAAVSINLATRTYSGGDAATDVLYSIENIVGSVNNDTITGDANNNTIEGGLGDDILEGGNGTDTVSYAAASAAVTVNLSTTTSQNTVGDGSDTITNFENILGSAFADTLTGNTSDNAITGGAGNDNISGGTGVDTAVFSGNWADYTITYNSGTQNYTVQDIRSASPDGTDTLTSIERLQFADRTVMTSLAPNNTPSQVLLNQRSVAITNPSFEANAVTDSDAIASASGWTGNVGTFNPNTNQMPEGPTLGVNTFYGNSGSASQTLAEVFSASTQYTLMVDVGDRADTNITGLAIRLYAGTVLLAETTSVSVPESGWQTVVMNIDGNSFATNTSALGQALRIELVSTGVQTNFDNVRLFASDRSLAVVENASNGTVVGSASTIDADPWDTHSYSLTDNAGGRFAINSTTGQITVANGSLLNHETTSQHTVTVRTTDLRGATLDRVVTIGITDVNEAPVAVTDTATAVEAGGAANGTLGTNPSGNVLTNDTDVDTGDTRTVAGIASDLVGWWRADGNTNDFLGQNNGTLVNGATYGTGRSGQAFQFDGDNDYLQIGSSEQFRMTNQFTLEAWVNPTGNGSGDATIFNKEGEYELARNAVSGRIRWAVANTANQWDWVDTGYVLPLNSWAHL
ncbi:MAG: LamG-like jellyroll fold domain-containing protein, partial [Pirellula sp.]